MNNQIKLLSLVAIITVSALLISATRPATEAPKQYILITVSGGSPTTLAEKLNVEVNQKISEGWSLQGGASIEVSGAAQAMVK